MNANRDRSPFERARSVYEPRLPDVLTGSLARLVVREGLPTAASADVAAIREHFPLSFGRPEIGFDVGSGGGRGTPLCAGVVLSGGQAPGGHNVIAGLFDGLLSVHPASRLLGFLGGPRGVLEGQFRDIDARALEPYRNTGGFDLLGSGRDKIETDAQLAGCRAVCERLALDGLVIIGGDDSNTNAALLAEHFLASGVRTAVNGVPKTIDGDLKGQGVEASFGFDTATKVYGELIGNICRDAKSAGKYWHFIKLMGRSASHVTLECALQTQPNVALIGEEIRERGLTLDQVGAQVAEIVRRRAAAGRHYGVCLVPEGLIEFVPEIGSLIGDLNRLLVERSDEFARLGSGEEQETWLRRALAPEQARALDTLPPRVRRQLLLDRDSHGNVQVSLVETELLLVERVREVVEVQAHRHFFGYEGRCAAPSDFDADYAYTLGRLAAVLTTRGRTGYVCAVRGLAGPPESWRPVGVPLTAMMRMEARKGKQRPVIGKALVRTDAEPFLRFAAERDDWALEDAYLYPGAIQYFGPDEVRDARTRTLMLESEGRP